MVDVAGGHCQGRLCITKSAASGRSEKRCFTNQKFIRMGFAVQSRRILGLEYRDKEYRLRIVTASTVDVVNLDY